MVGIDWPGPGCEGGRAGLAADERDVRDAGQALELEPGAGIGPDGVVRSTSITATTRRGSSGSRRRSRDLADAQAVEE